MAARNRRIRKSDFRFYVYAFGGIESPVYIGKGSGNRVKAQERRFNDKGEIIAWFINEQDAFDHERRLISDHDPKNNLIPGGTGGRVRRKEKKRRMFQWEREIERVGTRVYAARVLSRLDCSGYLSPSKIESIRRVAYG